MPRGLEAARKNLPAFVALFIEASSRPCGGCAPGRTVCPLNSGAYVLQEPEPGVVEDWPDHSYGWRPTPTVYAGDRGFSASMKMSPSRCASVRGELNPPAASDGVGS